MRPRAVVAALLLGAAVAVALEVIWPGRWQRGSTPRLWVTLALAAVVTVALATRWRR